MPDSSNPFSGPPNGAPAPAYKPQALGDDAATRMLLPVGRSIWAIIAGYAGLISLGRPPLGIVALISGAVAIRDIRKHPDRHGMGRAIFGIVTGLISTLATAAFLAAAVMREM